MPRRTRLILRLVLGLAGAGALALGTAVAAWAGLVAGDLDTTFGTSGTVSSEVVEDAEGNEANGVVALKNGKLIAAGERRLLL